MTQRRELLIDYQELERPVTVNLGGHADVAFRYNKMLASLTSNPFYEVDLLSSRSFEYEVNLWQNYWNTEEHL